MRVTIMLMTIAGFGMGVGRDSESRVFEAAKCKSRHETIATVTSSGSIVGAGGLFTVFTVLEKRWLGCVARANIVIKSE